MFSRTSIAAILCLGWFFVPLYAAPLPFQPKPEPGEIVEVEIAKGVKMKFCWIPAGKAQLGSPKSEQDYLTKTFFEGKRPDYLDAETESKRGGFMTKGFWLGKYAVTQEQWEAVMGNNPSCFSKQGNGKDKVQGMDTSSFPVEQVSWDDCQEFLRRLNEEISVPAAMMSKCKFALPHEDEWEYACRGGKGNKHPFYFGDDLNGRQANCNGNLPYGTETMGTFLGRTTEVGSYENVAPHPWGLCDMIGNVWQWCDNKCDNQNIRRVLRGGSWFSHARYCRSAYHGIYAPDYRFSSIGFRVAVLP
jgi:formylglycine-generating enzyme required for sulfatase activity